jgi:hypothetical protein
MLVNFNTIKKNHVMNDCHKGYTLKRGVRPNIGEASRMFVHLNAKVHYTTAFGEAKVLARAL